MESIFGEEATYLDPCSLHLSLPLPPEVALPTQQGPHPPLLLRFLCSADYPHTAPLFSASCTSLSGALLQKLTLHVARTALGMLGEAMLHALVAEATEGLVGIATGRLPDPCTAESETSQDPNNSGSTLRQAVADEEGDEDEQAETLGREGGEEELDWEALEGIEDGVQLLAPAVVTADAVVDGAVSAADADALQEEMLRLHVGRPELLPSGESCQPLGHTLILDSRGLG